MPYYLTTLVVGPNGRTRNPKGWDQTTNYALLKCDTTFVVVWSLDPLSGPGITLIADDAEELTTAATKIALRNWRGDAVVIPNRFMDAIGQLMLLPPGGRWPTIKSTRQGIYRVQLGPNLLYEELDPLGPRKASASAFDNFNRSGDVNASVSPDGKITWTEAITGSGTATITSNQVAFGSSAASDSVNAWTSYALDTTDHFAQIDAVSLTRSAGSNTNIACTVRAVNATAVGYQCAYIATGAGTYSLEIYDVTDDIALTTTTGIAAPPATIKVTANGSALEIFRNNTSISRTTDTTSTVGKQSSFSFYTDTGGSSGVADNFLMQDLGYINVQQPIASLWPILVAG